MRLTGDVLKKKKANGLIGQRLKVFRDVIEVYAKSFENPTGVRAMAMSPGGKGSSFSHANIQDFGIDVRRTLKKVLRTKDRWDRFHIAYVTHRFDNEIKQGRFVHLMWNGEETNLEVGLGSLWQARGIWPIFGNGGYLNIVRCHPPTVP